ncbi:energy transducer TonB [Luteimonas sp. R10]|uniref:energy transducer TonB n=1 Tax=Luteimonas sp. R10 TaxID=3108176 RepID=UPI0030932726|nr:energy transducer TonB [Luteimonas sp. R10]
MNALAQDRPGLRWGASVGVVLAAHVAVVGTTLWWRAYDPPVPLPESTRAVMVELAPQPAAPPAPPTELPPGSPQQEQRQAQPKVEPTPTPEPVPERIHRQAEVAIPEPLRDQRDKDGASDDVAQISAPPSVQAPTGPEYAAPQALSGAAGQALASWQAQVLGHLERFKRYPRVAQRRRYEGVVQVRYAVDRQGNVLAVDLARGSGHESLDSEAIAAVERASPLPPPTTEVPGDPVEVVTPVEFVMRR